MTRNVKIYGIKACDTMKKARHWLTEHNITIEFHDYKITPIDRNTMESWVEQVGWEKLLNRAGTTFRKLSEQDRADIDQRKAIDLMLAHNSLIKRPVLEFGSLLLVGFKPEIYQDALL